MAVSEEMVVRLTADIARFEASMNRATNTNARTARAVERRWQQTNSHVSRSFQALGRVAAGAFAALGGALAIREAVRAGDAWTRFGNQLNAVAAQLERPVASLDALVEVAMRSRSSLEGTVTLYTRLERAGQALGRTQEEMLAITETVNQAFAVGGATAGEQASAITQLSQAIASGRLAGDELRSITENAPMIAQAIADAMGVGIGELRDLGAEGRITADIILDAMQRASGGIERQFSTMGLTVSQAMTNLRTAALQAVGGADQATGATGTLAQAIDSLAQTISENREGIADFVELLFGIADFSVQAAAGIGRLSTFVRETMANRQASPQSVSEIREEMDRIDQLVGEYQRRIAVGGRHAVRNGPLRMAIGEDRLAQIQAEHGLTGPDGAAAIVQALNERFGELAVRLREVGQTAVVGAANGAPVSLGSPAAGIIEAEGKHAEQIIKNATTELEAILQAADDALAEVRGEMGEEKQRLGEDMIAAFQERHEQMRDSFRQAFSSGVMAGLIDGEEGLANWFRNAAYRGLENALTRLADQLFDLFAQAGGTGGGGGGGFFAKFIGNLFGGGKAGGGPVAAGMSYRVGEQGPETFVPKMPGVIVPHHVGAVSAARERIVERTVFVAVDRSKEFETSVREVAAPIAQGFYLQTRADMKALPARMSQAGVLKDGGV